MLKLWCTEFPRYNEGHKSYRFPWTSKKNILLQGLHPLAPDQGSALDPARETHIIGWRSTLAMFHQQRWLADIRQTGRRVIEW